ncbi:phosphoenolpyruvate-dependent sugar phosphotransferase system eiia 2 [Lucifera butyrica]|uniref:Phosphoenolpyruvate-dependent sugar phosphotransferase system eiia 2 n=1 Tax=Lucifera butyrica TaxID=1351585 RepID=A0A498RAH8_9FIRM|nr:PTS sugar transporter subunit IIA [Lucifera butyrica]VBB09716.1 phosphoenolpyruvate-dependent sugar phosphotransferase system eiia 2 [Lucifera butyrica]
MLKSWLTEKTIKVKIEVTDWEDAIRKGGELLEKDDSIESRYIDAMIDSVKEIGPYIVLAPGIAMPHARPEAGAKKIGISLLTLKEAVNFGNKEHDPVSIVVCLCAIDHSTHLTAMTELVKILGDDEKVKKIKAAENSREVIELFRK